ncbi:MAG: hypothetical protein KHW79_10920 [Clostridiales bacterium]|nr:hypothetical protein [Clostridiales bacterium]
MPAQVKPKVTSLLSIQEITKGDEMPIGAWVAPPPADVDGIGNPNFITDKYYQLAKEAGINILYGLYENLERRPEDALAAMNCALRSQLRYLAFSSGIPLKKSIKEMQTELTSFCTDHPAYLGVLAYDEPAEAEFDQLEKLASYYQAVLPDKLFYANLLPYCAKVTQIKKHKQDESGRPTTTQEYKKYLETFIQKLNPVVVSFDNYPCEGPFPEMADHYFLNLSMVSAAARKYNKPAWCFIQTCSWNNNVRVPSDVEILWQVNTALAYGMKGIQYFTFWQPLVDGVWRGGMIAPDGEKYPQYYYVQNANRQIQLCQHLLMNSHFVGLMVHGTSPAPIPNQDLLSSFGPLIKISGNIPSLAGCFKLQDKLGLYVVNNSLTQKGEMILQFCTPVKGEIYQLTGVRSFMGEHLTIALEPGAAAYIKIDSGLLTCIKH